MEQALEVIPDIGSEDGASFGRAYGLVDPYRCEDAEVVLIGLDPSMGTAKETADRLREGG